MQSKLGHGFPSKSITPLARPPYMTCRLYSNNPAVTRQTVWRFFRKCTGNILANSSASRGTWTYFSEHSFVMYIYLQRKIVPDLKRQTVQYWRDIGKKRQCFIVNYTNLVRWRVKMRVTLDYFSAVFFKQLLIYICILVISCFQIIKFGNIYFRSN